MNRIFNQCPACGGSIIITECKCLNCNLQMRGDFLPDKLSLLSKEHLAFIQVFLRVRGNLSETERVLGVSYPTIRNKLDEINAVLDRICGPAASISNKETPAESSPSEDDLRRDILKKVADGSLSAAEADRQIHNLPGDNQ